MGETSTTRPLLTIAIPTWNRSALLAESLEHLAPQIVNLPQIEVRIHDNNSPDDTEAVVRRFQARGIPLDYKRQQTNIGSDANFADCFNTARGRYVWLLSDDDIILPGAIPRLVALIEQATYELVYVTDFPFYKDALAEATPDPYGRNTHIIRDRLQYARTVSVWFTFISGIVANKEIFETIPHEPIEAAIGTNLVQLAWSLPLLARLRQGLIVYDRVFGSRQANSGDYSFGSIFGVKLATLTRHYLAGEPRLADAILHNAVRSWMPAQFRSLVAQRGAALMISAPEEQALRSAYGSDWRFWFFVWPVLHLSPRLAALWVTFGKQLSNVLSFIRSPHRLRKNVT